ncbi:CvpA family protein [Asticcacaulis sp. BYS171W]|uniref:CvpA family protein n=1 Tax=Asticcacaulis aquaticus TaxID=2984212 RepID=A0ABT5HQ00_9CAUL|nr:MULTISPECIES: CvpA family protein [Asticcacaulis]ESQ80337.1 hypothetical protein AEYBE204_03490 [Asticcacaulis sp. YBE204]MDC7682012.1 CvpA family protein [Asticcacaulis aquaticus]
MQAYDLIFLAIFLFSCLSGFTRGATREIVGTASFILAVLIAIWLAPWLQTTFNLDDLLTIAVVVCVFIGAYFGIRALGNNLSEKVNKQQMMGYADRTLGVAFGVLRALAILGFIHLLFSVILPKSKPDWFTQAKVYPLSVQCAKAIVSVAPSWARYADNVAPKT